MSRLNETDGRTVHQVTGNAILANCAMIEEDLARSALHDAAFAVWFMPYANADVLVNGVRAENLFKECGEFAKKHRVPIMEAGDDLSRVFKSDSALRWYTDMTFPPLPGGKLFKPTSWQMDKARKYMVSRHDLVLSDHLREAERLREAGEHERAEMIATQSRRRYVSFTDSSAPCVTALSDEDGIMGLAESNPPLFTVEGEVGRLLNARLKPDNLGIFLADPKAGKTTLLVDLAVRASRCVPTLFISAGDETLLKVDGRIATNVTCRVTQPEFAGTYGMPIPDCAHNAGGTCPIGKGGAPRIVKDWRKLIVDGADLCDMADGITDGSRTIEGNVYAPCCRCFPMNDGTPEDSERRRHWRSAVWWRKEKFVPLDRETLRQGKVQLALGSVGGGLRVAQYNVGELGVDGIYDLLDSLDRVENFVPQVIVLDYADLLKQEMGRVSDKDHDGMRRIWEGLRGITTRLHILLLTATQTNREGDNIETHTRRTIGRSAKAGDNCTWMATLNQTVDERRAKLMRMSMLYAREGRFDPEHQALVCQWHEIQHSLGFSMPIFCKIKTGADR